MCLSPIHANVIGVVTASGLLAPAALSSLPMETCGNAFPLAQGDWRLMAARAGLPGAMACGAHGSGHSAASQQDASPQMAVLYAVATAA